MAHSQVRLFLVAPTDRQTHVRRPGRKNLSDFDPCEAKLRTAICDHQSMIMTP